MANLSSKTGFTPSQTRVSLINNGNTTVQDFAAYDAQLLTGFVYIDATTDKRASVDVWIVKNGAGTYEVASADIAGDDFGGSAIVSFSMSGSNLVATLGNHTGFTSAYIQYILNAPTTNTAVTGTSAASGSGELSAITNDSFASDTTGWTGVTRVTSGSPLDPIVATAGSVANTATAETSTSGGYATISNLPSALRTKRLKVQFYFSTPATDVYRVSVYQGTTRLPLSTDVSGATTLPASVTGGLFTGYVDTTTAAAYSVNVTRTSGSTGACTFTKVIFGPGQVNQMPAFSNKQTYSPTIQGSTTNPADYPSDYWRMNDQIRIIGSLSTGTLSGTEFRIYLPSGLTVGVGSGFVGNYVKIGTLSASVVNSADDEYVLLARAGDNYLTVGEQSINQGLSPRLATVFANSSRLSWEGLVPIAEWANGSISVSPGADMEYVSHNGTNTVYGSAGSAFPTSATERTMTWQYPAQADDLQALEVSIYGDGNWRELPVFDGATGISIESFRDGVTPIGAGLRHGSSNASVVTVKFGSNPTAAGGPHAWSSITSSARWRVRKAKASAPVGIEYGFLDGRAQLYKAGQAPGLTTGAAIAAGYVGESTSNTAGPASISTTETDLVSLTLTVGTWLISGTSFSDGNTGVIGSIAYLYIKGSNSGTNGKDVLKSYDDGASGVRMASSLTFAARTVSIASGDADKTVKIRAKTAAGTGNFNGYIHAVRIA